MSVAYSSKNKDERELIMADQEKERITRTRISPTTTTASTTRSVVCMISTSRCEASSWRLESQQFVSWHPRHGSLVPVGPKCLNRRL